MKFFHSRKISDDEKTDWIRLARTETIGPITFHRLLARFGSAGAAIDALPQVSPNKSFSVPETAAVLREIEKTEKHGGRIIAAYEDQYPLSLAATEDAPPVLTAFGRFEILNAPSVGIVGSRNCSLNGRRFAEKIAHDLGAHGYVVASGLARGIDTAAHRGALAGGTIAVLAGGADIVYPAENRRLYDEIVDQGVVVSECPLGMQPLARHFPRRNRIITGLSLGTIVIEAGIKSGSLISARVAAEQGRDVFAVPGFPSDPRSAGTNALLKDGAILIRHAEDVIEHLNSFVSAKPQPRINTVMAMPGHDQTGVSANIDHRNVIVPLLSSTPASVDEIIRTCELKSEIVQACLLEMELSGEVQRLPGNRVSLIGAA